MGCRDCNETKNLRRAVRLAEAAADGALGVLANVQNLLTERAIDPTPFGVKEEETLIRIQEMIAKYVDVSRETSEKEEDHGMEEEERLAATGEAIRQQDSGAKDTVVDRPGPDGLGDEVQRFRSVTRRDGVQMVGGPMGANHYRGKRRN